MKAIGDPEYVHLGFHQLDLKLMLLGSWVDEKKAIRVTHTASGSFVVYSKPLIQGIQKVSGCLIKQGSYLLRGKRDTNAPAIAYSIMEAEYSGDIADEKKERPGNIAETVSVDKEEKTALSENTGGKET